MVFMASVMNQTVLDTGNDVGDLAMELFGEYTEIRHKTAWMNKMETLRIIA